ncbi:hypothetical protein [Shinella sp.]|jgi:hypothetical protein|uniref:hypothetical protein n=1 Tax=Shinella sp. TaxID=1870904 RepID=UPI003F72E54C
MAVSHEPVFAQGGRTVGAIATAAKTTYNDSANAVLLCQGGANGSIFKGLSAVALATVTASKLMLFYSPDNGTTMYLVDSVLMAAYTMAATTASPVATFTGFSEIRLAPTDKLYVASGVALAGGIAFTGQIEDM